MFINKFIFIQLFVQLPDTSLTLIICIWKAPSIGTIMRVDWIGNPYIFDYNCCHLFKFQPKYEEIEIIIK